MTPWIFFNEQEQDASEHTCELGNRGDGGHGAVGARQCCEHNGVSGIGIRDSIINGSTHTY